MLDTSIYVLYLHFGLSTKSASVSCFLKYFPGVESTHDIVPQPDKFFKFYFVIYSTYLARKQTSVTSPSPFKSKVQFTKIPHEEESLLRQNWLKGRQYVLVILGSIAQILVEFSPDLVAQHRKDEPSEVTTEIYSVQLS